MQAVRAKTYRQFSGVTPDPAVPGPGTVSQLNPVPLLGAYHATTRPLFSLPTGKRVRISTQLRSIGHREGSSNRRPDMKRC